MKPKIQIASVAIVCIALFMWRVWRNEKTNAFERSVEQMLEVTPTPKPKEPEITRVNLEANRIPVATNVSPICQEPQ